MADHPRQHKYYRLNIRVIEEVDVYKNKEDSHGGPGYYPSEVLIAHANTKITDQALPGVIQAVSNGAHNLNDLCRGGK
jgi:hypothetical protein